MNTNTRRRRILTLGLSVFSPPSAIGSSTRDSRRLHKERALTAWRSLDKTSNTAAVRPLDLKLDESDPSKVYQVGAGGFLEPYDFDNYQEGFETTFDFKSSNGSGGGGDDNDEGPALSSSSSSLSSNGGNAEGVVHFQSGRLPPTNFDLNRWTALRGFSDVERKLADEEASSMRVRTRTPLSTRSSIFKYTRENDPYDLEQDQDDASSSTTSSSSSRSLKKASEFASATPAKDVVAPVVRSTFPPPNTKIGPNQSFGALVSDDGGTGVKSVCLQLRDHVKSLSDCFELVNVGMDVWELTFDGFDEYEGETWSYRIRSKDMAKNRANTAWADFIINIAGMGDDGSGSSSSGGGGDSGGTVSGGEGSISTTGSGTKLTTEVRDESWPYGGVVLKSTGRILFFFDGNAYVCTGTVLDDGIEDRTIILTAAHCAYQYQPSGGRFAESALFIPDQDDTTGIKSDEVCSNDPYGCWIPAFAVVDYRWTQQGFPNSVPYDYAFYVIPNDAAAHEKGYLHHQDSSLSELLPELTEAIPVNWNFNLYGSDFTTGLGYSFDKDPDFRYCSGPLSTKRGIQTYENLWIGVCEMTGGSSGGPWMIDTDTNGRGTVVSVNSWGYTSSSGMAGPDLSTGGAECLFEKAKSRSLYDYGGYVVSDCSY